MADMKAANATSFNQYKEMTNAVSDSLKMVTLQLLHTYQHCAAANRW